VAVYPLADPGKNLRYSNGSISLKGVDQDPNDTVIVLEYEGDRHALVVFELITDAL